MGPIETKLVRARSNLVMAHPFFGALALRLKMVPNPEIKTARCNGVSIEYNPEFVAKLTPDQTQGLIAHEVMHPAFLHHTRRGNRDPKKWNIACDHSINTILKNAKFTLPDGAYADPAYSGMAAEHIYTLLPDEPEGDNNNNGDVGSRDGDVSDSPQSQNEGASQSQQNHEEAEWKTAVAQAAHVAKQNGKLPADIERMMEALFAPTLPWRELLHRFMTEKSNDDFSWARGNRRFLAQNLYLPSRVSQDAMGTVVITIDVSGSVGQKELDEFGSEIKGIMEETRPEKIYVLYCDAAIAHVDEFGPDDELVFAPHGGGGTDFRPPFVWLEENQITPKAFVYLTDGYGPFPEHEPDFPVLWCINNFDVTPPHGEHLVLEV